jgi:hypothetical protein
MFSQAKFFSNIVKKMILEDAQEIILERGDKFHVYRGLRHQMIALEDTELFEFSTQHFDSDSIRIIHGD